MFTIFHSGVWRGLGNKEHTFTSEDDGREERPFFSKYGGEGGNRHGSHPIWTLKCRQNQLGMFLTTFGDFWNFVKNGHF